MKTYKDVLPGNDRGLSNSTVLSLFQESENRIWIGTDGGGINSFNPFTEKFAHYPSTWEDKVASICPFTPGKLLISLFSQGGLGLKTPLLNESVVLSDRARCATGLSRVVCDWLWPGEQVVLEYDGHDAHSSPQQQAHDARKRDALRIDGFDLAVLTSSQFHHINQCTELLRGVARSAGQRPPVLKPEHFPRHMALREQVRKHHRAHFPSRFRKASS